jgi:hypothetical protein
VLPQPRREDRVLDARSPTVRLELRADGTSLAWYETGEMHEASRHAVAACHHPGAHAVIEIVLVDPAAGEVVLMTVKPREPGADG